MEMSESVAWLFRGHFYDTDPSDWTVHEHPNVPVIPLYTKPQKYCPSENNEAYEKGFIDGMNKQIQSRVQQMVDGYAKLRELTDEEIMEIYDRDELYNIDEGQMYIKPIEFAKELLKKASEK